MFPNGDYYTFARPDFSEGTFGHPWERTLCVFGPRLVETLGRTLSTPRGTGKEGPPNPAINKFRYRLPRSVGPSLHRRYATAAR